MDIIKIKGKSGYIKGGTNTGVYEFSDKSVLLIDAGHSVNRGIRMGKMLEELGLTPDYMMTTHEHFDHFEAYAGLKEMYENIKLMSHPLAKPYIENLYLGMAYMTASSIPNFFGRRNNGVISEVLQSGNYTVDRTVSEDIELRGERIQVIHTPGHCAGQMIVITPDKVCYLGDAVLDKSVIESYDMPFLFDIKLHQESLEKIKKLDFDYGIIGHGRHIHTKEAIDDTIDANLEVLERYEKDILALLEDSLTREELLAALLLKNNIQCNYTTYHYNNSTVGAYVAKLSHEDKIDYEYRDGKIYYYLK